MDAYYFSENLIWCQNILCPLKHHHLGFSVLLYPLKLFMIYKQGISMSAALEGQFNQWSLDTSNTHLLQHEVQQSQFHPELQLEEASDWCITV